ncbi:uncharacterized protein LOC132043850 [Lycium ferocissimum]|uniref:uncharacterized protein LOC132043850 n=1 Tax=Lycium ferocissimum TaxID=112874 RepID=UPI002814C7B7|nr:uncharacterized protein LOC132043850 [Lycium ferocissimum]
MVFRIISNNWYSILINGQPHGFFRSTRGVKQGDPLSPTLFILAAECLTRALNALHTDAKFKDYGMPKWSPYVNHLAYADDTNIFTSEDDQSMRLVMDTLTKYEEVSGQKINKGKSAVYMHHSVPQTISDLVCNVTQISRKEFPFTYLGVPIYYGRRQDIHYRELIEKVRNVQLLDRKAIVSWRKNHVDKTCTANKHWATWTTLCHPQEEGGMGFKSLQDVSKVLFAKLWWNMRTKQSLWRTFISNKYLKKFHAVIAPQKNTGTYVWKKMLKVREEIEHEI